MTGVDSLESAFQHTRSLQFGDSGSVVGSLETTDFMDKLYVHGEIDDCAESFFNIPDPDGELLIVTGSAGDGKSAILARAFETAVNDQADWLEEEHINLDATASSHRSQTRIESLNDFFTQARSNLNNGTGPRRAIAMNRGVALAFFKRSQFNRNNEFNQIWDAMDNGSNPDKLDQHGIYESPAGITVINLSYRPLFDSNPNHLGEGLFSKIADRFDYTNASSPFHELDELQRTPKEILRDSSAPLFIHNLAAISDDEVRRRYVSYLAALSLVRSEYINPRQLLHYIANAILPDPLQNLIEEHGSGASAEEIPSDTDPANYLFWNTAYDLLTDGTPSVKLDPCSAQSSSIDETVLKYTTVEGSVDDRIAAIPGQAEMPSIRLAQTAIRYQHLTGEEVAEVLTERLVFRRFAAAATFLDNRALSSDSELSKLTSDAFDKVKTALRAWSGRGADGDWIQIDDGRVSNRFQFFAEWTEDDPQPTVSKRKTTEETRPGTFWFVFENDVEIPFTFRLYELMESIAEGYNPNALDLEGSEGVRLIRSQISKFTEKESDLQIRSLSGIRLYSVSKDEFSDDIDIEGLS